MLGKMNTLEDITRFYDWQGVLQEIRKTFHEKEPMNLRKIGEHGFVYELDPAISPQSIAEFYLKNQEILSQKIFFWVTSPKMPDFTPHRDSPLPDIALSSLVFGLINCDEKSTTSFYCYDETDMGIVNPKNNILEPEFPDRLRLIDNYNLKDNRVYLFNNSLWHAVKNTGEHQRVVASWWAKEGVSWSALKQTLLNPSNH